MILTITKNQNKGMMGGVSFEVRAKVQLTEEERNLVEHYKLRNEILFQKHLVNLWGKPTEKSSTVRVAELVDGATYKCKDLNEVMGYTESVKEACEALKTYLLLARSFGGEEVYEFELLSDISQATSLSQDDGAFG